MNKIFSIALLCSAALSFTACVNEEDDLFDKTAAERLNEASALYSERLTASPNGWAVQLYPTTQDEAPYGNGYLLLFRFHKDKSVDASMNNDLSNGKYLAATSSWDVITDNGPVLSFSTYNNVIHAFSDPEDVKITGTTGPAANKDTKENDETGTGIGGDYEFIIVDAPEDASYMMLKGKKRGTYNLLTPVAEGIDYEEYLKDVKSFQSKMFSTKNPSVDYYHRGENVFVFADGNTGVPAIYPYGSDRVVSAGFNPFLITKRGDDYFLRFRDSYSENGVTVQDFKYNVEKDIFQSVDNEDYYICGDTASLFFDKSLLKDSKSWKIIGTTSTMSEKANSLYQKMAAEFKSKGFVFSNIKFQKDGTELNSNKVKMVVTYKSGNKSSSSSYEFTLESDKENCAFTYVGCQPAAQNVLNAFPSLKEFIDSLSSVKASANVTLFDLSSMKFSVSSDPNFWYIVSL